MQEVVPGCVRQTPRRPVRTAIRRRITSTCGVLLAVLAVVIVAATAIGPVSIPFLGTAAIAIQALGIDLGAAFNQRDVLVVQEVRLPRVLVGAFVGAALGISRCPMQGVFRNPLAEGAWTYADPRYRWSPSHFTSSAPLSPRAGPELQGLRPSPT